MPRPTKYTTRAELGWPACPADYANPKSGLVIHYDSIDQNLASKSHSACITYWNNTRAFHMGPSRGWSCIGYSDMACPHGYILEGRGLYKAQAAQLGYNSSHYSVTLGCGPTDLITPEQINAVRELRQWQMEETGNSGNTYGHRDFNSTSCPGEKAYALVTDGTFEQPPGAITTGDDDMSILSLTKGDNDDNGRGRRVAALQHMLKRIGDHAGADLLPEHGADADYGQETADAVLWVRQNLHGSTATNGNTITSYAFDQVWTSYIRAAAGGTSSGGSLPSTETVSVSGQLKVKR